MLAVQEHLNGERKLLSVFLIGENVAVGSAGFTAETVCVFFSSVRSCSKLFLLESFIQK